MFSAGITERMSRYHSYRQSAWRFYQLNAEMPDVHSRQAGEAIGPPYNAISDLFLIWQESGVAICPSYRGGLRFNHLATPAARNHPPSICTYQRRAFLLDGESSELSPFSAYPILAIA